MDNPYLLNRYGAALHAELDDQPQQVADRGSAPFTANTNNHFDESDDDIVDASVGYSRFPNATHIKAVVFQPTVAVQEIPDTPRVNNESHFDPQQSQSLVLVDSTPAQTTTVVDIEALIAATRAAMANAASLMHETHDESTHHEVIVAQPQHDDSVEESVSPVSVEEQRVSPSLKEAVIVQEVASKSRTENGFIELSSANVFNRSPTKLAVCALSSEDVEALVAKIAKRRPQHPRADESVPQLPREAVQESTKNHYNSSVEPTKRASKQSRHDRTSRSSLHHRTASSGSKRGNTSQGSAVIPLSALELILQTVRSIAPPTAAPSATKDSDEVEQFNRLNNAAPLPLAPSRRVDLPLHEVKVHPHVTFPKPVDANVSRFFGGGHTDTANRDTGSDADDRILPTSQLPAVGLSLLHDAPPAADPTPVVRSASMSPSRNTHVASRLMQPTQSWLHKGPEFQGIHLKNPSLLQRSLGLKANSPLVTSTEESKEERVSHFNRAASRALRIHSHLPTTGTPSRK